MANEPKAVPAPVPGLRIRSVPPAFWRAGRKWTKEPQVVPVSDFTKVQLSALKAESNLVVEEIELKASEVEA